ncbi:MULTISPECIES: GTP cyclohydrolase I FolE [Salinivibrio]|uniref:GTP cyclohydrolase 1 n=2 Tax=Salinivibrio TaxID=51366 RepID=A0ABY7LI70_9GAMM|nr:MULTISPECIES: GTP cyclohydrolase I FolE [Salinivibrio]ODQ01183.1 GTP cyclohydrolase I FolE [Salinivibrio sp. DV]OOF08245.1 GTP cyclohydrolase I FolE [Salinivibrio sp. PR5]OOF14488.1 GTP cyclohydrolase I FolE [Salinivibrio sp. PR919]OOF15346.1 GTP cyclohydrolase I FolE [Salinivibrio sp. PR932]OOF28339.1 GTP cyclohydrolase I FolE [Salinivibrio sp. IB872]
MMALSDAAKKVQEALVARGIETPMTAKSALSAAERKEKIEFHMREILQSIDLDLTDDSLAETPARIAKMYVDEIFSGLDYTQFPKVTMIENKMGCDEMVRVKDISVTSTCEHHLVTIDGRATVAYLPDKKVIGLSKINRIVRFFAQRPQVQERLTRQVLVALQTLLETDNVAVRIEATHYCVKSRGVMDANSETTTTALGGQFKKNAATRAEFLHGIN